MNDRDSELVTGLLIKKGYKLVENQEKADVILFNTCSVRQRAEDKVWSEIGRLKRVKRIGYRVKGKTAKFKNNSPTPNPQPPYPIVGLIGCMAQEWQQAVFDKTPFVDLVVGPNNISAIPQLLEDMLSTNAKCLAVGATARDAIAYNTEYIAEKSHCNVNIMEGCNNFCSYCIVPYVRGRERSRLMEEIMSEIKALIKKGVKEITLLGQNVNSYLGGRVRGIGDRKINKPQTPNPKPKTLDKVNFIDLLHIVNDIKGLESFDFVTSHPKDVDEELFKAMAEIPKCKKFLHLPVQSGSDRILKKMNRGYSREHYIEMAKKAKEIIPGLRLSTDVMVGFPGETEEDFKATFDLMKEVEFDAAYIFKYSPRPHTKAAQIEDDVPVDVKKKRNQILLEYQKQLHKRKIRNEK